MTTPARRWMLLALLLAVVAAAQAAWLVWPWARELVSPSEETAAARGWKLAGQLGCFGCHGPDGIGGVANPGSKEGEVPAFTEQTQMMYVKGPQDLREYVLDGAPRRRLDDPDYVAQMQAAALQMPAYRGFVTDAQLEDLVVYLRATSGQLLPHGKDLKPQERGYELALELDCFGCHGPLGAGGVQNPGSFKGYIPGFWGEDFDELVADDAELRAWIADGRIPRIADHPVGGVFFERQRVKMPAYGRFLPAADIDALAAYVRWVRDGSWRPELQ